MNDVDRRTLIAGASIVGAAALVRAARADLNPPPGPIQPTGKSLRDIEPRTALSTVPGNSDYNHVITQGGAYYLTGDVVVPSNRGGILVLAPAGTVSIDLNGFSIRGGPGSLNGIVCPTPGPAYLEVFDGYIRDFDQRGIDGGGARMLECDDLYVFHCGTGIVARASATIHYCTIDVCIDDGLWFDRAPSTNPTQITVDDCECRACGGHGIRVQGDWSTGAGSCVITDTDCLSNGGDGIHFTIVSSSSSGATVSALIDDCRCSSNGGFGHRASNAFSPGSVGARFTCAIDGLDCAKNALGGLRCFNCHIDVIDCDCSDNDGDGFMLDTVTGSLDRCTASRNGFAGVHAIGACRCCVSDCACHANSGDGLNADLGCSGLSITECDCQANTAGFRIQSGGNSLLWNTAAANGSNFVVSAALPIAVISGGELTTSCNPHANYSL
jgi:hypothetical protein